MTTRPSPAFVLRATADLYETNPAFWGRLYFRHWDTGCRCVMGGIAWIVDPADSWADPEDTTLGSETVKLLERYLTDELGWRPAVDAPDFTNGPLVGKWNDSRSTVHEVIGTLREAARWAEAQTAVAS